MKTGKNVVFILGTLLLFLALSAQSITEKQAEIERIKAQTGNYYFGSGEATTRNEANQIALQQLMSQISVVVKVEVSTSESERAGVYSENVEQTLKTYSYGRLPDVNEIDYKIGPVFHIFRYIAKEDYRKIFDNKKVEICGILSDAESNMELNQFGKAFRNYYRAALAIESLPERSVTYRGKTYDPDKIFNLIRDVGNDISIKAISNNFEHNLRTIVLEISYKGNPVHDLNLYYYDLHAYIPLKTNQSKIQIDIYGTQYKNMNALTLKIDLNEGLYSSASDVSEQLSKIFLKDALEIVREISLKKVAEPKVDAKVKNLTFPIVLNKNPACPVNEVIAGNLQKLFSMLENEKIDNRNIFSDTAVLERMQSLIDTNHLRFMNYQQKADVNKTGDGWEVRQLGVVVKCTGFPARNETIVVDFDAEGKIYNICYTINPVLHEMFQERGTASGDWNYRQVAIKFLENYKTAYIVKSLEDVEALYSEDALIITGKVVEKALMPVEFQPNLPQKEIVYFRQTRAEHIERQKEIFSKNKFVWLQFDTFEISSAPVGKIYGVAMKQNYFSSTYKDEGYLFLLIDFRGEKPLIHVRNWQPGEWDLKKLVNMADFKFH
ncbi:MAG: hypothetical protein PHR06_02080 [Candidatus Cloacimonetes bacterium]|nr:hypothetical protein [Candidatus Cloacimonadota bacterium]